MSRSEHMSLLKRRTFQLFLVFFLLFVFIFHRKEWSDRARRKKRNQAKGWQERYDHLSISFLNIKVGNTETGDAGHHSADADSGFSGQQWIFIHWQSKSSAFCIDLGWLMSLWTMCSLSHEYMTAAVASMALPFVSRKMLTGMLFIYLSSLHSAQHAWIPVCQYTFHTLFWFYLSRSFWLWKTS